MVADPDAPGVEPAEIAQVEASNPVRTNGVVVDREALMSIEQNNIPSEGKTPLGSACPKCRQDKLAKAWMSDPPPWQANP